MNIHFTPKRSDDALTIELTAPDRIRVNGELFNFGPLGEGDTIPAGKIPCDWIVGPVERIDSEIHLALILPHGPNPPDRVAFPESIHVTEIGSITLPSEDYNVDA